MFSHPDTVYILFSFLFFVFVSPPQDELLPATHGRLLRGLQLLQTLSVPAAGAAGAALQLQSRTAADGQPGTVLSVRASRATGKRREEKVQMFVQGQRSTL